MSALTPFYERWIHELAGAVPDGESGATCGDCAMLAPANGLAGFDPTTKCCTYTPAIPNFLVGAALADERLDPVGGRVSLRSRIAARAGVSPLGLDPPPVTSLIAGRAKAAFGKAPRLRCPHYHVESGLCGIWLHRNAVCSTWFCKHDRGAVGMRYWHALRDLLVTAERELTRWCVLELDGPFVPSSQDGADRDTLSAGDVEGSATERDYLERWGEWAGREIEWYGRCHELVRELSWADVVRIAGPDLGLSTRALERASRRRDRRFVPTSLLLRRLSVLQHGDPTLVESYSAHDPLAVPQALLHALPTFRGQPVSDALAELAEAGLELDEDLLGTLTDFELLVEPGVTLRLPGPGND